MNRTKKAKRMFEDNQAISPTVANKRLSNAIAALCITAVLIISMSGVIPVSAGEEKAENVIFLIGDGMGFAQVTAARVYAVGPDGDLNMDTLEYTGYMSTHSLNSLVTDSAAAGTALACGKKTNNKIISQSPAGEEYVTILEVAKELGKATGIVTTARITHATPAVFGAHSSSRYNWDDIAKDYLYQTQPDLLLGGGLRYWLDDTESGSHRTVEKLMEQGLSKEEAQADDGLIDDAETQGYTVVYNQSGLDALDIGAVDKVLGLFALSHMSYEFERPPEEPHIGHMTQKALEFLEKDPDGFFLMVEGARIDHAGHANNITLNVQDTIAFDEAVRVALEFAEEHPDTLVVVTADHECGGLSVEYPFESFPAENEYIKDLDNESDYRHGIWTSGSHTAVDVPVMASGPCATHLTGRLDNTEIFDVMKMAMTGHADATITGADVLVGRAVLPANTFAPGPTSGQFIGEGPINGVFPPFSEKQPVQGFSAVLKKDEETFYVMSDNGFGKQGNSQDYVLRIYEVRPDFETAVDGSGIIEVEGFITLRDPDELIPFTIVADLDEYPAEGTAPKDNISSGIPVSPAIKEDRLLTGADFDIESIQQVEDGTFWIGDEFGPFLLHVDAEGKVLDAPIPLPNVSSPQNPYLENPSEANLPRSRGFEGMALSVDGSKLYPMLEGALITDPEQTRRIIYEFDLRGKNYTGNQFHYRMNNSTHAIGDFIAVNEHEFLVIERDGSQGDLNGFKKIFKVDLSNLDSDGFVEKVEVVNLLNISDPDLISLPAESGDIGLGDQFAFPFVTIEDVVIIDSMTLGVLNDNNYPFSTGRNPNKPDDNEFIIIRLSGTAFA